MHYLDIPAAESEVAKPFSIAIDPSGNVWLVNNWREIPLQANPGANSIAVMVGAAAPLRTPVIGAPIPFDQKANNPR